MLRRSLITGSAAALAAPRLLRAQGGAAARPLRSVPQGNPANVDSVWTTTTLARNHGLMVYDTLFGRDSQHQPKPQMAASHEVSADGLVHTVAVATLEGKGVSVLDMAGLAQKGGPVWSHVRIAARQDLLHASRIAAGEANLLLGCDIVVARSEEHTSELQSRQYLVCRLLLETKQMCN